MQWMCLSCSWRWHDKINESMKQQTSINYFTLPLVIDIFSDAHLKGVCICAPLHSFPILFSFWNEKLVINGFSQLEDSLVFSLVKIFFRKLSLTMWNFSRFAFEADFRKWEINKFVDFENGFGLYVKHYSA